MELQNNYVDNEKIYTVIPFENNLANIDINKFFSDSVEVVPGQLLASIKDNESDLELIDYLRPGNNVLVTPDNKQMYAVKPGRLCIWKNFISVEPVKKIENTVTSVQGLISHKGVLFVDGLINDGKIEVNGDLYITNNIQKADIKVSGNLYVKGGIVCGSDSSIKVKGIIFAKYIEDSSNISAENIVVNEAILRSKVSATKKVIVNGLKKNAILGGMVCAGDLIAAGNIGSETFVMTDVTVGLTSEEKNIITKLKEKKLGLNNRLKQIEYDITELNTLKSEGSLSDSEISKIQTLNDEKVGLKEQIDEISTEIIMNEKKFNIRQNGLISSSDTIYPGCKLSINKAVSPVNSSIKKTTAYCNSKNEVDFKKYVEPEIMFYETEYADLLDELKPESYDKSKIVRKSIIFDDISEEEAVKKASNLLRLSKNNYVNVILDHNTYSKENAFKIRLVEVKDGENPKKIKQKITPFDKNKAVVVEGENIEACLKKVSKYFKVSVDKLDYKILNQKNTGLLGVGKKIFQLKVFMKKETPKADFDVTSGFGSMVNDLDGYFTLMNTEDGLMLSVYVPRGSGKVIEEQDVIKEINLYGYDQNISFDKIREAISCGENTTVKIAPRQREPELDGSFDIRISEDKLKGYITLYPPQPGGFEVNIEDAIKKIEDMSITNYNKNILTKIFQDKMYGEEIVFAEGNVKVEGKDAYIDYKIKIEPEKFINFEEDDSGKVDFHKMNLIENVVAGQSMARKIEATKGIPGKDIFGNVVPANDGNDIVLTPGKNISVSDDGLELIADIDGHVVYDGKKVRVEPIYQVSGDVSYETGNITFLGTVIVTGTVRDDFVIRASGDVFVGSVAGAEIEAEGNIVIRGGISGRDKANIKAGGNFIAKFVEQANIVAGKNVIVQEAIMHSNVSAGVSIYCMEGKKGLIVGGTVRAGEEIYCKDIGSKIATKTNIEVGIEPSVRENIMNLEMKLRELKEKFDKVRKGIKALSTLKKKVQILPPQKENLLLELVGLNRVLNTKVQSIQQELKTLQNKMRESKKGRFCVMNKVYTGVKIVVKNAILHVDEEMTFSKFTYENGEVKLGQYEQPSSKKMESVKNSIKEPK